MKEIELKEWGLNEHFYTLSKEYPQYDAARVISQAKDIYLVVSALGKQNAVLSGKLRYEADSASDVPAVGDFVMIDTGNGQGQAVIHYILPRKSVFVRRESGKRNREQIVAANIDTVFICMSLNNDFNLRRLERYLSAAWNSGSIPVVVLTKADLCANVCEKISQIESVAIGADILVTSALKDEGYNQLLPYIKEGKTVAFIGSSGVGKSTLVNGILGEDVLETNGLRNDDKGRHTTTRRELFQIPWGGMVIDTPGMRELGMWSEDQGLETTFSDIEELAGKCRFNNCTHQNEPGCQIQEALSTGRLSVERWLSYKKLMAENDYSKDSKSFLAQKEKKFKEISKINKNRKRK